MTYPCNHYFFRRQSYNTQLYTVPRCVHGIPNKASQTREPSFSSERTPFQRYTITVRCVPEASWHLKSLATQLFVKQLVKINNKDNIKSPSYWLLVRCTHQRSVDSQHKEPAMQEALSWCHVIIYGLSHICVNLINNFSWQIHFSLFVCNSVQNIKHDLDL